MSNLEKVISMLEAEKQVHKNCPYGWYHRDGMFKDLKWFHEIFTILPSDVCLKLCVWWMGYTEWSGKHKTSELYLSIKNYLGEEVEKDVEWMDMATSESWFDQFNLINEYFLSLDEKDSIRDVNHGVACLVALFYQFCDSSSPYGCSPRRDFLYELGELCGKKTGVEFNEDK